MCGVTSAFGAVRSGWPGGSGSASNTSSAAPAIVPPASAATSAASSTIGPRDVFTSTAVGFIRASSDAPISPRVRSLRRVWTLSTSARSSSPACT